MKLKSIVFCMFALCNLLSPETTFGMFSRIQKNITKSTRRNRIFGITKNRQKPLVSRRFFTAGSVQNKITSWISRIRQRFFPKKVEIVRETTMVPRDMSISVRGVNVKLNEQEFSNFMFPKFKGDNNLYTNHVVVYNNDVDRTKLLLACKMWRIENGSKDLNLARFARPLFYEKLKEMGATIIPLETFSEQHPAIRPNSLNIDEHMYVDYSELSKDELPELVRDFDEADRRIED
jgi:hypothetical protein